MPPHDPRAFFPHERFGEIRGVVPMTMGLSGAVVYAVTTAAGDFILRVHGPEREAWTRSILLQRLAAEHGIAPRLESVDPLAGASVSVKISGIGFGRAMADPALRAAACASLVQQLAALHRIPLPAEAAGERLYTAYGRQVFAEQACRPGFPAWATPLAARLDETAAVLEDDARTVLSHCDLNPANMLWDGAKVWFVDWERAGPAHPYLDLATVSMFLAIPEGEAIELLARQEQSPITAAERALFAAIRDFARIVYGATFLRLVPDLRATLIADYTGIPTLPQYYAGMATGTVSMGSPSGQAVFGAVLFKQCEGLA